MLYFLFIIPSVRLKNLNDLIDYSLTKCSSILFLLSKFTKLRKLVDHIGTCRNFSGDLVIYLLVIHGCM